MAQGLVQSGLNLVRAVRVVPALPALEAKAVAARPDLRAAELTLESAGRKLGLADAEAFALSGILDANSSGKEGFEMAPLRPAA